MREVVKGNLGNKIGFDISSEDTSITELSKISQNSNSQPTDRTLATQTIAGHVKAKDRIRERRSKRNDFIIKTLFAAGVLDQAINDGKGRKAAISFAKDLFDTVSKKASKLLPK